MNSLIDSSSAELAVQTSQPDFPARRNLQIRSVVDREPVALGQTYSGAPGLPVNLSVHLYWEKPTTSATRALPFSFFASDIGATSIVSNAVYVHT